MNILDPTQDGLDAGLYRAAVLHDAPLYVKSANTRQLRGDDLPASAYADPVQKQFPMHSAAATWYSTALLEDQKAALPALKYAQLGQNLAKAAAFWGIDRDIAEIRTKTAALSRDDLASLPDQDFALVETVDGVGKSRNYPLRNPTEVKAAAAWLTRYRDDFPTADRRTIARRILEKTAAHALTLDEHTREILERAGGWGYCGTKEAAHLLRTRIDGVAAKAPELAVELTKLATAVETSAFDLQDSALRAKLAAFIDEIDHDYRWTRRYDHDLERPDDVLYGVTAPTMAGWLNSQIKCASGTTYEADALTKIAVADFRAIVGDELTERLSEAGLWFEPTKLAQALPELADADAALFDRACAELGIPVMEKEAARQQRLNSLGLALALS